jgi:glycosyltransferase involved in cell wall biosynthesis
VVKNYSHGLVSVVIPVMNEVVSLNETLETITSECPSENFEFIVVLSPKSELSAVRNVDNLIRVGIHNLVSIIQKYPGLGGAYSHGFEIAKGKYIIMMASDLETDPSLVKNLISQSRYYPNSIITTTRWSGADSGFEGYGALKLILNWIFQKGISLLYKTKLTDYTFGFRLYPRSAIVNVRWQARDFAFLLESLLLPIESGWEVIEIPHKWRPRTEGESNNRKRFFFAYLKIAFKIRFFK